MTEQPPKPPRKPFGYDPTVVDQMLADRDSMLALAERRVREAESKAARLEEQLSAKERALTEMSDQLAAVPPAPPEAKPEPVPEKPSLSPQFMTEELTKIIEAAEESTSQILERARASTHDQIVEAEQLWGEVQAEAARFASWRDAAAGVVAAVQSAVQQARVEIESVPERIQSALAPAVEAMLKVDAGMATFAAASALPPMATPSGIEHARAWSEAAPTAPEEHWSGYTSAGFAAASGLTALTDNDWPSLDEPPAINGDEGVAEAVEEFREFAGSGEEPSEDVDHGSQVWGS